MSKQINNTCARCGHVFNISEARRLTDKRFGQGIYDDYFEDNDVCKDCAFEDLSAAAATAEELEELMGDSDDDD